jgi:hypothetical protein
MRQITLKTEAPNYDIISDPVKLAFAIKIGFSKFIEMISQYAVNYNLYHDYKLFQLDNLLYTIRTQKYGNS